MWALLVSSAPTVWSSLITVNSFDDIQYWAGSGTNRAALVLEFGVTGTPASAAWGYRWNEEPSTAATMLFSLAGTITGSSAPAPVPGADPRLSADVSFFGDFGGYFVNRLIYEQAGLPSPWAQEPRTIEDNYFADLTYATFYTLNGTGGQWNGSSFLLANVGISETPLENGAWMAFTQSDGTEASKSFIQPVSVVPEPRMLQFLLLSAGLLLLGARKHCSR